METVQTYRQVDNPIEFQTAIQQESQVIALIYASWCPFCRAFLPIFQKYAQGKGNYIFAKDDQEILADRYSVEVVPTILLFENGELTKRLDGELGRGLDEHQMKTFLQSI